MRVIKICPECYIDSRILIKINDVICIVNETECENCISK